MERFQIFRPVFSDQLPEKLRKFMAVATDLRQTTRDTISQVQQQAQHLATHAGYAANDISLVLMRTGLHIAADLQRFFINDISLYSCAQCALSLLKQAVNLIKK